MQKMLIILFSMTFLFRPVLPVVEYIVNYDYIVAELCINKDTDNLKCNGKCHLTSELAEAADTSDNSLPERKHHFTAEILYFIETADYPLSIPVFTSNKVAPNYCDLYFYQDSKSAFHPPAS